MSGAGSLDSRPLTHSLNTKIWRHNSKLAIRTCTDSTACLSRSPENATKKLNVKLRRLNSAVRVAEA